MITSQTPEGLEPCPFCGGEAWLNDYEAKYSDLPPKSRAPQCKSCGATLGYLTTPAKATEAWNRRVTAASAQAAIDAEKAKVAELEARIAYLRGSRDGHAAHAHSEFEARVAAEARADRLADIVKLLDECIWFNPDTQTFEVNHDGSVEKARTALQQETQP